MITVANRIFVAPAYAQAFEERFRTRAGLVDGMPGFISNQLLRPVNEGDPYFEFEFKGVSWEWKYKLSDPVADTLGTALYFEGTGGPAEAELEAKLIVDKRVGNSLFAFNVVGEHEWEFEGNETEREIVLEFDVGFGYFLTPRLFAGLELRNHNEFPADKGWEHSALFVGPVLSYAQKSWWMTLTIIPQLPALKGGGDDDSRILDEHEKINARILFGFHL